MVLWVRYGVFELYGGTLDIRSNSRIFYCSGTTTINGGTFTGFADDPVFCYSNAGILNVTIIAICCLKTLLQQLM